MLEPIFADLPIDASERIAKFQADDEMQARVEYLASRANEGELTAEERLEYESLIEAGDLVATVQAIARRQIQQRSKLMLESTRRLVRQRAQDRCEYCQLAQEHYPSWRHHVEHIVAKKHGGTDDLSNLALACVRCNLGKSSNLTGIDPVTGEIVPLFNPRTADWTDHFQFINCSIEGLSSIGRATVGVLNMNDEERRRLRAEIFKNDEIDS